MKRWRLVIDRRMGRCGCGAGHPATIGAGARQLLVDVSVIYRHDARTGVQRVVRALLLQLLEKGAGSFDVRPVFATRDHGFHYAHRAFLDGPAEDARWRTEPTQCVSVNDGDVFLGLDLAAHLLPRHRRQITRWKRAGVKMHVLVHDLLPVRQPQWFNRRTVRNFRRWLRLVADCADGVLCVSRHTEAEFRDWLAETRNHRPIATARIMPSGDIGASAPSSGVTPEEERALARLADRPFVLMVGTIEPRKGYACALAAFEWLWRTRSDTAPALVIVGRPGWRTDALQRRLRTAAQSGAPLTWFDNASDELLERLYTRCGGVLLTSHAEGFGLPAAEAIAQGAPLLSRNLPVFWETARAGVDFFGPDDPVSLGQAIATWIGTARRRSPGPVRDWSEAHADLLRALAITTAPSDPARNCSISKDRSA